MPAKVSSSYAWRMINFAGLSKRYRGEAVSTTALLRNRCQTLASGHEKSPRELWTHENPLLKKLAIFGCYAYMHVPKEKRSKFDARATLCRFLGYSDREKAYRFEEMSSTRILVSRDAQFMEDTFDSGKYAKTIDINTFEYKPLMKRIEMKTTTFNKTISTVKPWASKLPNQFRSMSGHDGIKRNVQVYRRNVRSSRMLSTHRVQASTTDALTGNLVRATSEEVLWSR